MASIFTKDDNYVDKPNRNTFDLSFQNNLTTKFGKLVPCFLQEVIPGDSFRIKPTFGLRFLPQVFPVQTRMRAHVHFFYVRNRTLWKDWMDFIGKTKEGLVMPYLQFNNATVKNIVESSIFDYMGLPTTLDSDSLTPLKPTNQRSVKRSLITQDIVEDEGFSTSFAANTTESHVLGYYPDGGAAPINVEYQEFYVPINVKENIKLYDVPVENSFLVVEGKLIDGTRVKASISVPSDFDATDTFNAFQRVKKVDGTSTYIEIDKVLGVYSTNLDEPYVASVGVVPAYNLGYPISALDFSNNPYNSEELRINALPFRAYEAIYNSFYRNAENNPFRINGKVEYNKYITSDEGGAQDAYYRLFDRNWEDDAYTTAVPTPQQGHAPLIGLVNQSDTLPFRLTFGNDDGTFSSVHMGYDAQTGAVKLYHNAEDLEKPALVGELNEAMIEAVKFGITINDLRNVNALQLWLEKNVRKGYKYRDQLMSHYGVRCDFDDLLMPEFIGGVSRDVQVNQISQTVETDSGNLGDMAGQAYVVGDGESISTFCDEHGFIIGIMSVAPVPNYSQIIPKCLLKHDAFDIFFPEFGKIGMQPIANKYLAPLASWAENKSELTFGYQRAWWDYLANVDQVHGKFNGQFYDYLLQRKFRGVPELGASFTTIKTEDLNNIFYAEDDEDKILGQVYFDVKAIRPIPLFGIPSIE